MNGHELLDEAVVVAARANDFEAVTAAIRDGRTHINAVARASGRSLLHIAAFNASEEMILSLLSFNPNTRLVDHRGMTPGDVLAMLANLVGQEVTPLQARIARLQTLLAADGPLPPPSPSTRGRSEPLNVSETARVTPVVTAINAAAAANDNGHLPGPAVSAGFAAPAIPAARSRSHLDELENPMPGRDWIRTRAREGLLRYTDLALLRMTSDGASIAELEATSPAEIEALFAAQISAAEENTQNAPTNAAAVERGTSGGLVEVEVEAIAGAAAAAAAAAAGGEGRESSVLLSQELQQLQQQQMALAGATGFGSDLAPAAEYSSTQPAAEAPKTEEGVAKTEAETPSEEVILGKCVICLEEFPTCDLRRQLGSAECNGAFCGPCLAQYIESLVLRTRYTVPPVKCPSCYHRIPTAVWKELVSEQLWQTYTENAHALLSVRCPDCHEVRRLFDVVDPHADAELRSAAAVSAFDGFGHASKNVLRAWRQFARGAHLRAAEDLVDALEAGLWACQPLENIHLTVAPAEGAAHSVENGNGGPLEALPSYELDNEVWDKWSVWLTTQVLPLVRDTERRLALHLAWLRRHPAIRTPCCNRDTCFKCKIEGWHNGTTCAQRQATDHEIGVQFCPACNVATVKSEGCNHIICVCGENWTWLDE